MTTKKYTINLDVLHLQVCGYLPDILKVFGVKPKKVLKINEDLFLEKAVGSNKDFHITYRVYYKCIEFAILSYMAKDHKQFRNRETSIFKINNPILYTKDFVSPLKEILKELELTIVGINKLEVCIDGNGLVDRANRIFLKKYRTVNHRAKLDANGNCFVDGEAKDWNLGTDWKNNQICIYRKSQKPSMIGKEYIREFWTINGILEKNVDRLELKQYKNINEFSLNPDDWTTHYLKCYFRYKAEDNLTFHVNNSKRKSYIFNFNLFPVNDIKFVERVYKIKSNTLNKTKSILKYLYLEHCYQSTEYSTFLETYKAIIKRYQLYDVYLKWEEVWEKEQLIARSPKNRKRTSSKSR